MTKYKIILIIIVVNLLIHFGLKETLLSEPPIWPDEAFYVNIVKNYSQTGILKLTINGNNYYEMHKKVLYYPPFYFYLINTWGKLFGLSPTSIRLFSTTNSFIVIFLISLLRLKLNRMRDNEKNNQISLFSIVPIILLSFDFTFLRSTRILRPEITELLFIFLSFYFYECFLEMYTYKRKLLYIILTGIAGGVAGMTHFNGFIFTIPIILHLIFHYKIHIKTKIMLFIFYLFSLFSFFIFWTATYITDLNLLWLQMTHNIILKSGQETFFLSVFYHQTTAIKILYLFYSLITIYFISIIIIKKRHEFKLIAYYLMLAWILALNGKMFWYYVFPIPFVYLALELLITQRIVDNNKTYFSKVAFFLGITNISIVWFGAPLFHYPGLSNMLNDNYSYLKYIDTIKSIIPKRVTVFSSSIPDPYVGLHDSYQWYQFPGAPIEIKAYLTLLNNSDYIIINGIYESRERDNLLIKYIQYNTEEVHNIAKPFQYKADIIKLKPKNQRIWR